MMTGYLTLLGPTTAAIVYTTANATITITIAKANSFSIVSPIKRSQLTYIQQAGTANGDGDDAGGRRLPRSKQIRQFPSLRIAL